MQKKRLFSKNILHLHSNFWFWPLLAGGFFALGYSSTKNIFMRKFFPAELTQQNSNRSYLKKEFSEFKRTFQKSNHSSNKLNKKNVVSSENKYKKKIIHIQISDGSFRSLDFKYSEKDNSKKQAVFENSVIFFQQENVESLMKTLRNPKKAKSSKIKSD